MMNRFRFAGSLVQNTRVVRRLRHGEGLTRHGGLLAGNRGMATTSRVMATDTLDLTGVYPPIITPFDSQENIAWDKLQFNIEKWNKIGFAGSHKKFMFQ